MPRTGSTTLSYAVSSEFPTKDLLSIGSLRLTLRTLADIQTTPEVLGPLINKSNTFILLQNGVGIEQDLRNAVPNATIISGCAWIDATAVDGGKRVDHFSLVSMRYLIIVTVLLRPPHVLPIPRSL